MDNRSNQTYYISTIFALLIWSTSFIGTKIAYASFSPITLGAARFIIASIVLGMALIIKKEYIKPHLKDLGMIAISGVLGITLYFTMENIGVSLTSASNAALIVASYPAITVLLELFIYKARFSKYKMLGILMAIVGVYILLNINSDANSKEIIGSIILIATGVVWAFYNFTTQKMVNKYPAITLSFYQTAAGTIFFIPLAFVERKQWQVPTETSFLTLVYLSVFCSVIAFLLYNFGLRKLSSSSAVSLESCSHI